VPDKPALVYPPTFWALIEEVASTEPDSVILTDDRGRRLTNRQYREACEATAAALVARGVGPDSAVSWQLPTVLETLVVKGALSRLGARQNPIIPILRRREVAFITTQTKAELLIVPGVWRGFDYAAMADDIAAEVGFAVLTLRADDPVNEFGLALPVGDPATLPPAPAHLPAAELPVRWIYFSSGTTSDPKGGRHTDQSVMAGASGVLGSMGVRRDDVVPMPFPVAHIGGICMFTTALVSRCTALLVEVFDAERTPFVLAEHGGSLLGSAVPFFHAYLAAQRKHGPDRLFPRIRACISGGAPKPPELHYEIQRELGGRGIVSSWGLTEFPIATYCTFDDSDEMLALTEGRASPGVDIRVVDFDERDCGPGEEGELRLKGPQMIRGYVDASLDADAFDSSGFFRTGDLGVVEATGHVRITGRLKDVILRNAETISAQEIENVLYTHPKIADVAVIGLPDAKTGERCCAVVVLAPGASALTLADLAQHCVENGLAKQKIPEQVEIVDVLPRNAMGKILKQELRARYRGAR
jgi:acyl-CoA synthetase (AMP-forming)/AMP-acid ligase II